MQMNHIKYALVSSIISAFVWFAIVEIDVQSNILWSIDPLLSAAIPPLTAVILGTYVGLWGLGRIRRPFIAYGIVVGLLSFLLYLPFDVLVSIQLGNSSSSILGNLPEMTIAWYALIEVVASLVSGLLGAVLVFRMSPSFCAYCGNKLPSGRDACPKCGKMQ